VTHPAVRDLFHTLSRHEAFQDVLARLVRRESGALTLSGLTPAAKALYLVLIWQATERPLLVVADGNQRAELLTELTETFFDLLVARPDIGRPQLLPAWDVLPAQRLSPHTEIAEQRAIGLWRIANSAAPVTVVPVSAALLRIHDAAYYRRLALDLHVGEELPLDAIATHLESIGYSRRDPVEMVGEYSIRGGILDVFGAETARPLRVEFFGDEIESIRRFDVESQRSVLKISEAQVLPLVEQPRSRQLLHAIAEKLDYENVASPGDIFPGWEFAAALAEPRRHSLLERSLACVASHGPLDHDVAVFFPKCHIRGGQHGLGKDGLQREGAVAAQRAVEALDALRINRAVVHLEHPPLELFE
jgi:transcription-repair coupling factor (superfamily II helicase)